AEPGGQILQAPLDPGGDVEPRDVARQDGGAACALRERRGQLADRGGSKARRTKRQQRAACERSRGLAGDVAWAEQIHDELATIRRDERRAEDPALDEPRPGASLALPDERPAGPHDREGEWLAGGHRQLRPA